MTYLNFRVHMRIAAYPHAILCEFFGCIYVADDDLDTVCTSFGTSRPHALLCELLGDFTVAGDDLVVAILIVLCVSLFVVFHYGVRENQGHPQSFFFRKDLPFLTFPTFHRTRLA